MDGEQRDSKNTTKNLFVGLAAANEKKASNPSGECDNPQNNGKRRRVSFGRRITYFQPPSSTAGSSSSYVRMASPTPTPSPLPPDLFEDTHAIFDHFQQRAPDATKTLLEDSVGELQKSMPIPEDVISQIEDDYFEALHDSTGELIKSIQNAPVPEGVICQIEDDYFEALHDSTGGVMASIEKETDHHNNSTNEIVTQMEEDVPETTEIIDTSPIPEEVICQIEDGYFEALHEYVEKMKLFYKLQDEKLQLLDQMKERTRAMREENQAFWANLENGIVELLREVNNARGRGPQ